MFVQGTPRWWVFHWSCPKSMELAQSIELKESSVNPIGCGGGGKRPPSHTFAIPRKKLMGKVANFFWVEDYFFQSEKV